MAHLIQTGPYTLHCFFLLLEFNRVLDNGIIIKDLCCHSHVSVSSSQVKTTGKQTSYSFFSVRLCRHLVIHVVKNLYPGEKETHWDKTNKRLTSSKVVIFFVCLLLVRFLLTSITGFFCTTWMARCKGPIKFMNAYKTSWLVFPSDGVWDSRRTLITQSKTKLELVNRVISAEELEIRTSLFSSDSTYDTIACSLMETR